MRHALFKFIGKVLVVYGVLCLILFTLQRSILYFPTAEGKAGASTLTLKVGEVSLRISTRPHEGRQALIYFGGNAEDVTRTLPQFATAFPDHAVYMPHYRGYGGSSGQPTETALHQDALAVFEMVREKHPEILLVGRSLGSGVAIRLAAGKQVSRLVLITPFDSILNVARQKFFFMPVRLLLLDTYESWRYAPLVQAPTLILAADRDEIIPMKSTLALHEAFTPGVVALRILGGADHNSISNRADYMPAIQAGK